MEHRSGSGASELRLRAGEWVEVRSEAEILLSLDENGCLDNLPFMPEMLKYCGKRLRVQKSAHKTCDTIHNYRTRGMSNAVHLEGVRCDGSAHGACQALCLIFWKEAWLKRVTAGGDTPGEAQFTHTSAQASGDASAEGLARYACYNVVKNGATETRYRCQTTDLLKATKPLDWHDPRHYWRDLTSGNVGIFTFIRYVGLAALRVLIRRVTGNSAYPYVPGLAQGEVKESRLNLQPGETVKIKPVNEIYQTLDQRRKTRGLSYDVEMEPFSGQRAKVLTRIERIIDERSGKMLKLNSDCIVLDDVYCGGCQSRNRLFCPRAIYPYWREQWLERT